MDQPQAQSLYPYYLGAYAENDQIFEKLLLELFRDHAFWRRNFHPENRRPIPTHAPYSDGFNEVLAKMQQELHTLGARLKRTPPFFSPRYMGSLGSDMLLPGLLAEIMTMFYNPNNCGEESPPVTLEKELEVGYQFARLFGFQTEKDQTPRAWGHLTGDGILAHHEALSHLQTLRYFPVCFADGMSQLGLEPRGIGPRKAALSSYTSRELFRFSATESIALLRQGLALLGQTFGHGDLDQALDMLLQQGIEQIGYAQFFRNHPELAPPKLMVTKWTEKKWSKIAKSLGWGRDQLVTLEGDDQMHMDIEHLSLVLEDLNREGASILGVVGVLGHESFGTVDPIHHLVRLRNQYQKKGFGFAVHVEASMGAYMTALFRDPQGHFLDEHQFRPTFEHFPSNEVYRAFAALKEVDSLAFEPHRLGFFRQSCGAFVGRDDRILNILNPQASFKKIAKNPRVQIPIEKRFQHLRDFILENNRPGATSAAVFVTHRCISLDSAGFGQIFSQCIHAVEYFKKKLIALQKRVDMLATLTIPFPFETNSLCYAINPRGNRNLALANHFSRKIHARLQLCSELPLQAHHFFVSSSLLKRGDCSAKLATRLATELGFDEESFCEPVRFRTRQTNHLFLFQHTLSNPWLLYQSDDQNYLDRFCDFLEHIIVEELAEAIKRGQDEVRKKPPGTLDRPV